MSDRCNDVNVLLYPLLQPLPKKFADLLEVSKPRTLKLQRFRNMIKRFLAPARFTRNLGLNSVYQQQGSESFIQVQLKFDMHSRISWKYGTSINNTENHLIKVHSHSSVICIYTKPNIIVVHTYTS